MLRLTTTFILCLFICCSYAYNQNDLLNAQTNFQAATNNMNTANINYTAAQQDVTLAESAVQDAKKNLANAEKDLKAKQESAVLAKKNLDTAKAVYKQSSIIIDNLWNQVNKGH
jgi:uncharacterized protein (DUF3084 family)